MYEFVPSLRQLRTFAAVAQSQSISRASADLHLSQSAVTQAIAKLETDMGVSLFVRRNKGTYLTDFGTILQERTQRFFDSLGAALSDMGGRAANATVASRRMTRAQMLALIAINETGSFMQGARHVGISQTSLHRSARALEAQLQTAIFQNTAHGVTTNAQGTRLARRLLLAARELEWAQEEIEAKRGTVRGRILVGTLMRTGSYILTLALDKFASSHPNALISITNGSYDVLLNKLRSGSLDFVVGQLKSPPPADDVVEELLLRDSYFIAARRGHPLAGKPVVTSADLANFEWISPTAMAARRQTYEGMFGEEMLPPSNIETHSLATILLLLASSDRLTMLTQSELMFDRRLGHNLTPLNFAPLNATAEMGVTTRRGWLPTKLQRTFLQSLRWQALQQSSEFDADYHNAPETAVDFLSPKIVAIY